LPCAVAVPPALGCVDVPAEVVVLAGVVVGAGGEVAVLWVLAGVEVALVVCDASVLLVWLVAEPDDEVTPPAGTVNAGAPDVSVEFESPPPQAASANGDASSTQHDSAATRRRVPLIRATRIPRGRRAPAAPSAGRTPGSR